LYAGPKVEDGVLCGGWRFEVAHLLDLSISQAMKHTATIATVNEQKMRTCSTSFDSSVMVISVLG
jgi:hypothetical protein